MRAAMNRLPLLVLLLVTLRAAGQLPASEASVMIFLATDCPISQKYIPALNRLVQEFSGQGVQFAAYVPGRTSGKALKAFDEAYALIFPLQRDRRYRRVQQVEARVTPEVFLFDAAGVLRYRGAIDNWFFDLGGHRQTATQHYLRDALEAVLRHTVPTVTETEAIGCPIQVPD